VTKVNGKRSATNYDLDSGKMLKNVLGGNRQGTLLSVPEDGASGFFCLIFGSALGTLKSVP
jgi:hypothetical protein